MGMHLRFWGTRGSIPTPGPKTAFFGGNTSCVEVRTKSGTTLVLDCGTGIRLLGLDMLSRPSPHRIHLLIGHTHWDHIQGFPFFTQAFLPRTKLGWGHSPGDYVTDVAMAAGAATVALFHHDPAHDDETIQRIQETQRARAAAARSSLEVFAAAEGMELEVIGKGWEKAVVQVSALERRPVFGRRVLIVTHHRADVVAMEQVLPEDGLVLTAVSNGRGAVEMAREVRPDLVIINGKLTDGDSASFIQQLRTISDKSDLPIIVLTEAKSESEMLYSAESTATDYMARPFGPPMLRTRVRAWLARTSGPALFPEELPLTLRTAEKSKAEPGKEVEPVDTEPAADIFLPGSPFAALTTEQRAQLMVRASEHTYTPGEVVIRQDDAGAAAYVIISGRVRLVESVPDSPMEMFLGELGPGEIFGEIGGLGYRPGSASVVTLERTRCVSIPTDDFVQMLRESPELSMALLRVLAGRLDEADRLLARYAPDPLTGLPGRRAFQEVYRRLTAAAKPRRARVGLRVLDVLHLKDINDRFGYSVGNDVLRTVADALIESSRSSDLVARHGGDEFALLLIEAAANDAEPVINRVQQKLRQLAIYRNLPVTIECRCGYAFSEHPPDAPDELLRIADEDMQAKSSEKAK